MDAEMIGAIFAGVTGLLTVALGFVLNRAKNRRDDQRESEVDGLRRRFGAALAHVYELRALMRSGGLTVPPMPDDLEQFSHQQ